MVVFLHYRCKGALRKVGDPIRVRAYFFDDESAKEDSDRWSMQRPPRGPGGSQVWVYGVVVAVKDLKDGDVEADRIYSVEFKEPWKMKKNGQIQTDIQDVGYAHMDATFCAGAAARGRE